MENGITTKKTVSSIIKDNIMKVINHFMRPSSKNNIANKSNGITKNRTVQVIGGLTRVDKNNRTGFITQHLTNSSIKQRFEEKERVIYFPTSNISLKKKVLEQFTFDEKFPFPGGEDLEFGWRLQKNKIKMLYDESIIVTHNLNPSLKSFLKRNYHYGIGNMLVKKMYPEHPLLLNINTKNKLLFYLTMAKGILETPFFGIFQLNKLTQKEKDISAIEKMIFFNYFCLHKLFYMFGNINEFQQNRNTVKKPDFLIIDCTHRCNLRCKDVRHCERHKKRAYDKRNNKSSRTRHHLGCETHGFIRRRTSYKG